MTWRTVTQMKEKHFTSVASEKKLFCSLNYKMINQINQLYQNNNETNQSNQYYNQI
jgi:hypothetical protein